MAENLPCDKTGVCNCITIEEWRKTNKKLDKVAQEVEKLKDGHACIQRDRITQLENRQDKNTNDIREDIQELSLDVRSALERLDRKKEENGYTKAEIEHIHQEESDLSKEVEVIKERLSDHEKIMEAITSLDTRMTKQEERHQALIDLLKDKEETTKTKEGFLKDKRSFWISLALAVWTIASGIWIYVKEFL